MQQGKLELQHILPGSAVLKILTICINNWSSIVM